MTFTQLEYLIAVDTYKHFGIAAEKCFVTQPTLSMQIQKLEKEWGVRIFDRSKQPVLTTDVGIEIIAQAKAIIASKQLLEEQINAKKGILAGELRVGIIPTLAPYILPLFISNFTEKYPLVKLIVQEYMTEEIMARLKEGTLDAGILATPLHENGIQEYVLFYEELVAYVSKKNSIYQKEYLLPSDIDPNKLWLLEEGHCFRSQIAQLCELQKMSKATANFEYEASSIETLRKMIELNDGITILPELATLDLTAKQQQMIRPFKKPTPMREVSLVVHRNYIKRKLIGLLKNEIVASIPEKIRKNKSNKVLPI